ncbi:MAG: efflux RND transporter periplasmic adaptor subunit [Phormidesmis sp.]
MTYVDALENLELVGFNKSELVDFSELVNFGRSELMELSDLLGFSGLLSFGRAAPEQATTVQLVMVQDSEASKVWKPMAFSEDELAEFRQSELVGANRPALTDFRSSALITFSNEGLMNGSCSPFVSWVKSIPESVMLLSVVSELRRIGSSDIRHNHVRFGADLSLPKLLREKPPALEFPQVKLPKVKPPQLGLPIVGFPIIVMAALVTPTVWLAKSPEGYTQLEPQVLPVETMSLTSENGYEVSRVYTGELVARRSSDLGFERMGTVVELLVEEGDTVVAGEPLARLDMRDLLAQRQQLEAQKRQLQAQLQELEVGPRQEDITSAEAAVSDLRNQLELAQLQADRRAALYAKGAISREELDERQFGANAIADRLQQAQSQLEELLNGTRQEQIAAQLAQIEQVDAQIYATDISLDKSVLYAPFSGTVAERVIDEGAVAGTGQRVMRLVENGRLEARIGVPESTAQQLALASRQSLSVGNRAYPAVVTARLPEVDEVSQTVTVVLELDDSYLDSEQSIGITARLQVKERQAENGYWLPNTALVASERGLWSVYVLSEQQANSGAFQVTRRDVEVLYSEGNRAFVRGLVQPGEVAIVNGNHRIVPGQLVKPNENATQVFSDQ